MGIPVQNERYTYKDYLTWDDDTSWELINGIPYNMSPSPSLRHQTVLLELAGEIREFLKDKPYSFHINLNNKTHKDMSDTNEQTFLLYLIFIIMIIAIITIIIYVKKIKK